MPKKLNDTKVLEIVTKHANGTSFLRLKEAVLYEKNLNF